MGLAFGGMDYLNNGDGTVLDLDTGLTWTRCALLEGGTADTSDQCTGTKGVYTWAAALDACNTLDLAGRTWRLPNIKELHSIITYSYEDYPMVNIEAFPNIYNAQRSLSHYWSSTSHINEINNLAWQANLSIATVYYASKADSEVFVQCVSGPDPE